MPRTIGVIPARMGSSRFPGKPLASILGRPMIEHVYKRAAECPLLHDVLIATCDDEIAIVSRAFGANVVMTSARHQRATDRVAEVNDTEAAELVVMIQGDEPLVRAEMIAAALQPLLDDENVVCTNLMAEIHSEEEAHDPDTIKVVTSRDGWALYFSRAPIPSSPRRASTPEWFKQVCVIAFRRVGLQRFSSLPAGPLEERESIDMLRFLENGIPVRMVRTECVSHAVDRPTDITRVQQIMEAERSTPESRTKHG